MTRRWWLSILVGLLIFMGTVPITCLEPAPLFAIGIKKPDLSRLTGFSIDFSKIFSRKPIQPTVPAPPEAEPGEEADKGGPVSEPLPWVEDERFEELRAKYDTPMLMGAYKATLPDPILNEGYNIGLAADMLAGTVLQPGEVFSQNRRLAPYSREKGFREGPMYKGNQIVPSIGGGVCKIASLLYNVTVLSNLKVVERHPHSMTVPYVPPGQDATVATGARDYRFKNTSSGPVLIWAKKVEHTLYMAFYGRDKPPIVTWEHETLKTIPYTTKVSFNPKLAAGEERVVIAGSDGMVVRSWLVITREDGAVDRRDLGKDYYNPCPRVIERGAKKER